MKDLWTIYKVDAFTGTLFKGNPACVIEVQHWPAKELMLNIAAENAVAETAFFKRNGKRYELRWFTPEIEMDLCGHATLATAHIVNGLNKGSERRICFDTASGELQVEVLGPDTYSMLLPCRPVEEAILPDVISQALSIQPQEVFKARDFVLYYSSQEEIENLKVDKNILDRINLDPGGVVVTAEGRESDFVSRYFTPQSSILEDPVTGSSHCSLIPFWRERLGKDRMKAYQLSERGGLLYCSYLVDKVRIRGQVVDYMKGLIQLQ